MQAFAIEQDDPARRTCAAKQYVLGPIDERLVMSRNISVEGDAASAGAVTRAGRDDDGVGSSASTVCALSFCSTADIDTQPGEFPFPPRDRVVEELAAGQICPERQRAAQAFARLEQRDSWPFSALTRAASSPPGPPPTMTTFDGRAAGAKL